MRRNLRLLAMLPVAAAGAFLLWGEVISARASTRGLPEGRSGARRTVLVLGFGNRTDRANAVNRYRVRAALRTLRGTADVLIVSGGSVRGPVPEGQVLAAYARHRGFTGTLLIETESRSTAENIRNTIPLLEGAEEIAIVSNSLHAEKARGLLRRERADLAARLIRADEYRFGEVPVIKALAAAIALVERRRSRADGTVLDPR
ncbi:YdcF family protein [Microbacterium capsulatum]|uniref:YdcF family protein n=1 Tax=Microbacterium capsulatum TaxID=3041921 RepID=A0ABU0XCA5_9MICO|nr:YdcF family protein [Microbacterium sp. ASV81]MDQ4212740.1 YdcF family protein [Microbacterium sp. ASV81]